MNNKNMYSNTKDCVFRSLFHTYFIYVKIKTIMVLFVPVMFPTKQLYHYTDTTLVN